MKINSKLTESSISNEEFTQRLSTMEKKLQRTMAEKETLLHENQVCLNLYWSEVPNYLPIYFTLNSYLFQFQKLTHASAGQRSQNEMNELVQEKDETIEDLMKEGEKLSRQVGKHSEIIKKLRSKEKSNEKEIKALKTDLDKKKDECDRFKKSLSAKDEVETKQIEAIQNLTNANSKWEEEHNKVKKKMLPVESMSHDNSSWVLCFLFQVKSELEDGVEKVSGLKKSLEGAYKEIAELKRGLMEKEGEAQEMALSKEMAAKQALQEQLRELQDQSRREKDDLYRQIDELRETLSAEERSMARKEEQIRRERDDLMARLVQSENRHEELSGEQTITWYLRIF